VPFVVRGPFGERAKNTTVPIHRMVSLLDLAPTMMDIFAEGVLAKAKLEAKSEGEALAGVEEEEAEVVDEDEDEDENHHGRHIKVDLDVDMDVSVNVNVNMNVDGNPSDNPSGNPNDNDAIANAREVAKRLIAARDAMDGLSFWGFLNRLGKANGDDDDDCDDEDPFVRRTDLLISYHGEGTPRCNFTECPPPLDGKSLWYEPDSYNNTYHCLRTMTPPATERGAETTGQGRAYSAAKREARLLRNSGERDESASTGENSIYCMFQDDERFVEYYDLNKNPHQLGNDYRTLSSVQIQRYEKRLRELLE